ncbi:hypothetical protein L0F63_005515 [Massospora cicadina]|nr:hypothetical protein L0F63_005515 [Massospora cicadina]
MVRRPGGAIVYTGSVWNIGYRRVGCWCGFRELGLASSELRYSFDAGMMVRMTIPPSDLEFALASNLDLLGGVPKPLSPQTEVPRREVSPLNFDLPAWAPQGYPHLPTRVPKNSQVPYSNLADLQALLDSKELSYTRLLELEAAAKPVSQQVSHPALTPPAPLQPNNLSGVQQDPEPTPYEQPVCDASAESSAHHPEHPAAAIGDGKTVPPHATSATEKPPQPGTTHDLQLVMQAAQLQRPLDSYTDEVPKARIDKLTLATYKRLKAGAKSQLDHSDYAWLDRLEALIAEDQAKLKAWLKLRAERRLKVVSEAVVGFMADTIESQAKGARQLYPRHFNFVRSVPLTEPSGAHQIALTEDVASLGTLLDCSSILTKVGAPLPQAAWTKRRLPRLKEDPLVLQLIQEREIDAVISSSGLAALAAVALPDSRRLVLPVHVTQASGRKTAIIEKPLPSKTMTPRLINEKFFNSSIKRTFLVDSPNTQILGPQSHSSSGQLGPKAGEALSDSFLQQNAVSYAVWKFGALNVLIRCKLHGALTHGGKTEVASLKAKLEYAADFGAEVPTPEERARGWVHSLVRGDSLYLVAQVDPIAQRLVSYTLTRPALDVPDPSLTAPSSQLMCQLLQAFCSLPPNVYMAHHEPNAHSLNLFKAGLDQEAPPAPKLGSGFQRRLDLASELDGPLSIETCDAAIAASYRDITWADSPPSSHLRDGHPFLVF